MRLDAVLDAVYLLSSLGSGLLDPQVCPARPMRAGGALNAAAMTAFVDVHVIPMDTERVLANQTVLVEGRRITALGPANQVKIPAGAVRIDGRGKYLMPGLTDMHFHLWGSLVGEDSSIPTGRIVQDSLFRGIADGVTAVRFVDPYQIFPRQYWRDAWQQRPEAPMPHVYFAPHVSGSTRPDSAAEEVAAAKAAGYDFFRMPGYLGPHPDPASRKMQPLVDRPPTADELIAVDSMLATARRVGLPVAVHGAPYTFSQVLAVGPAGGAVDHAGNAISSDGVNWNGEVSTAELQQAAVKLQRAGVWVTPTLQCSGADGMPSDDKYDRYRLVKVLHEAGVKLLLSGDDGWTVHDELAAFIRAGLPPYQALRTGTYNPADYFHQLPARGTVAVGKQADLVLLAGNPLQDIQQAREPVGVMLAGRWLDRTELDRRLLASESVILGTSNITRAQRSKSYPWLVAALNNLGIAGRRATEVVDGRLSKLLTLTDALAAVPPSAKAQYEPRMQQLATELGVIRAALKPMQQTRFDPVARVWLREQHRQGYQVMVSGVAFALTSR